jgi:hypothetical protein
MDKPMKCAHPACKCVVRTDEFDDYCSARCRDAAELTELRCECGHPECADELA